MSIITQIQTLLDESGGLVYWSANGNQPVYDAANTAISELYADLQGYIFVTAPFVIASNTPIVALSTTSFMIPQYTLDTNTNKVFMTVYDQLQDWQMTWLNNPPSTPQWFVLWDADHVRVFPTAAATTTYTMCGVPWPPELALGTDTISGLDVMLEQAIVHKAAGRLLEFTQPELADKLELESLEYQKKYQRQLNNQQGANTLRLRPGKGWTIAQFGDIRIGRKYQ